MLAWPRSEMSLLSILTFFLSTSAGATYLYVDLSLNRMGASATEIGLNASMPALAWLLATPFLPVVLRRWTAKAALLALVGIAALAVLGFPLLADRMAWLPLRFLLGGGVGLAFRVIEYWISAASPPDRRGWNVGVYTAVFFSGAALGSGGLPAVGLEGWPPVLVILGLLCAALLVVALTRSAPPAMEETPGATRGMLAGLFGPTCVAVTTAAVAGLFEAVPYTLMPVYVLRVGLTEGWASWTASAFLLGQTLFPIPLGLLADRWRKPAVLTLCGVVSLAVTAVLPATTGRPELLLAAMFVWGGFAGSLYVVALSMLADHFRGAELAAANATFGTLYAAGSLAGPLLHGAAMDWYNPQGLMESAAALFLLLLGTLLWHARPGRR